MSAYIITWVSNNGSVDDGVERAKEKKFGGKSQVCIKFLGNFSRSSFSRMAKITKVRGPTNFSTHFDIDFDPSFNVLFFWNIQYFPAAMPTC